MATTKKTKAKAAPAFRLAIPQAIREHEYLQGILEDAATGASIPQVAGRIMNVNSAMKYSLDHAQFDPQAFDDEMVAVAVRELLTNKGTPATIKESLCSHLEALARSTGQWGWAKATDSEDIDKWLPSAIEAMRLAPSLEPVAESAASSEIEWLVKAIVRLQEILPESARKLFLEALDTACSDTGEGDTSRNPVMLKAWLPKLLEQKGATDEI